MKILVTGVNGQLGYDVCRILAAREIEHRGVDIADFDITDADAVERYLLTYKPDAVIHCSAYTAVDKAEDEESLCMRVNADGAENIAKAAKKIDAKMMMISTDYVFEGVGTDFYSPEDPIGPQSVYGRSKAQGEARVRAALPQHFIVRVSWLFGKNGNNFVKTMLRLSETKSELNVVNDQIGSPTYSYDVARLLCDMIVTDRYGTYHATNEGICSWAEFAAEIMRQSGKEMRINPIPSAQYPTRAKRPLNSRLCKSKLTENGFLPLPDWKDALKRYLAEI